ncbi:hypothetical protein BGZ70_005611 [Mortierella alpina]|uniref:Uncharacterized protein n=1 Tax=Mortierella alpina TaxID=64518 RepID=A0A9P6JJ78_MORAP|nr:hypothetical protein BGZ70_005611 [Mortierella alpina]
MWAPSFSTTRNIQIFTLGLLFGSIVLFTASYALEDGLGVTQYLRILTNVNAAIFLHVKNGMSLAGKRKLQICVLCLSCVWITVFLGSAGGFIYLAQTRGPATLYLVVGFDIPIGLLLIIDAVLMELYSKQLNSQNATSTKNDSADFGQETHETGALLDPVPLQLNQTTPTGGMAPTIDDMETGRAAKQSSGSSTGSQRGIKNHDSPQISTGSTSAFSRPRNQDEGSDLLVRCDLCMEIQEELSGPSRPLSRRELAGAARAPIAPPPPRLAPGNAPKPQSPQQHIAWN